jgi:hypothetical protein
LKGIGLANVPALGGLLATAQHDASLTVVHPAGTAQSLVIHEHPVAELSLGQLGYQMLIGRDLLDEWLLVRNGPAGVFSLSY